MRKKALRNGSAKPGPSEAYVRLIEGKISSASYVETITHGLRPKAA
jgi:hypothetical protein